MKSNLQFLHTAKYECLDKTLTVEYSHLQECRSCSRKTSGGAGEEFEKARMNEKRQLMPNIPEKAQKRIPLMLWYSISRKTPYLKLLQTKCCDVHINVLPWHRTSSSGENVPFIQRIYMHLALGNQRAAYCPLVCHIFGFRFTMQRSTEWYFSPSLYMEVDHCNDMAHTFLLIARSCEPSSRCHRNEIQYNK